MKNILLIYLAFFMSLVSFTAFSQTENTGDLLGLPGDNLDLYAVLNLFQKSKTIEDFEKSLNEEKTGINNLDLNNDKKVDFIKVETKKDGDDFLFILQDPISEKETQDVAVISVTKNKDGKVSMQIIGDKDLYGKDYIVEPNTKATPSVTANPGYTGDEPVAVSTPASTVVVVESAPIVQYVYSPAYAPYYPPYYYGYYPPYFAAFTVMAVGIYRHNNYYHHNGYNNTVVINNNNHYNNYNNNSRNTSNTVNNNVRNGNYNTAGKGTNRASTSQTGRATAGNSASTRPSTSQTGRATAGNSASTRPSTSQSKGSSSDFIRPSTSQTRSSGASASTRPSSNSYNSGSRSRASSSSYSRPSSSMGSMSRGGGGGRRR